MKNVFKVLGVIALVAVIGFGLVSCGGDDDKDNNNNNNNNNIPGVKWPTELAYKEKVFEKGKSWEGRWKMGDKELFFLSSYFNGYKEYESEFAATTSSVTVPTDGGSLVSVGSGTFTFKDSSGTERTVTYSVNADGNTLTISNNGGWTTLTTGDYTKETNW